MAEAALFNISQAVLTQLGSKILQEAALLWGIGDDVKNLTRTLSSIQAVLLDAEEKSHSPRSHQLRLWLKELRQVVYDAEDLLDDFSIEVRRHQGMATAGEKISKEVRSFFSSSNQVAYGLKIAHGIQAIRATLDEIAERRGMFHLEVRPVESMARKSREQTHSDVPEMVVGREDERERVLNKLLQHSSNCKDNVSVISIVGIGGLGKTILAQLVYNDEAVKFHFELKAWVCVSEKFEVKLIIEKIIESCTNQAPGRDLEMDTLRKRLYETVNGKRYFIVLDDVWSEDREKWSRLKGLLKGGAEGSRVMITTRLQNVAKLAATRGMEPYELKGLNERESWSLFQEIAFEGGEAMSGRHESIGREILEKCKGVPLAIKTVAGALFFKESESEWIAFKSKGMWEMDENENDIMPTLKLSYDQLPTHLKHCFAYCSLFPKDYEIDVEILIHLWIAQGFVQSSDPSNRFDVGLGYFNDLLWRSFFQERKKGTRRNRIICKMHDLMHDLAISIAGEEFSASLAVLKSQDIQGYDSHLRISRHVLLDYRGCWFGKQIHEALSLVVNNREANKARTLLGINLVWGFINIEPVIFSNTISLRALDLSKLGMSMLSHTVDKLKHLKYFDLSCNNMMMLPEGVAELVNLEVLKLDDCRELLQLPKGIGKLSRLFHLGIDGCDSLTCMPRGIGQLCYLRELPLFVIAEGGRESTNAAAAEIGEFRYLNNLRGRLVITNLEKVKNPSEGELADLKGKQHLEELSLLWEERGRGIAVGAKAEGILLEALCPHPNLKKLWLKYNRGSECPSWIPSVMSLVELQIVGCQNWKHLPSLDQLPFLAELRLQDLESLEYTEYCGVTWLSSSSSFCSFFPSLKFLGLKRCPKFKGWLTPEAVAVVLPQFPCVSELKISDCASITSIPSCSLKLIKLKFKGGSKELLKQILRMPSSSSPSSVSPPQSSCLSSVKISKVLDLDTLPEETLLRLTYSSSSLEILTISNCPELRSLSPAVPHHLTSLQHLNIWRCEKLDLCDGDDDEMMQQQQLHDGVLLPRLSEVYLNGIPKLSRLPEWLQLAPKLLQIQAFNCPIAYVPEWMPKLIQLQTLMINSYGKSASQCVHEDWSKIAHISKISINNVYIHEQAAGEEKFEELEEEEEEETEVIEAAEEEGANSNLLQFFVVNCGMIGRCFQG